MTWFLVVWVSTGTAFGGMSMSSGSVQTKLAMPSEEICRQVAALNNVAAECWAKPEK